VSIQGLWAPTESYCVSVTWDYDSHFTDEEREAQIQVKT
jgi:hypothetical protein